MPLIKKTNKKKKNKKVRFNCENSKNNVQIENTNLNVNNEEIIGVNKEIINGVNGVNALLHNKRDEIFIKIKLDVSRLSPATVLVDTGADINLINENCLKDDVIINTSDLKTLSGLYSAQRKTLGSVIGNIILGNKTVIFKWHVVDNTQANLPGDGILGRDFLRNGTIINTKNKTVEFYVDDKNIMSFPLIMLNKGEIDDYGVIQNIDSKIVFRNIKIAPRVMLVVEPEVHGIKEGTELIVHSNLLKEGISGKLVLISYFFWMVIVNLIRKY